MWQSIKNFFSGMFSSKVEIDKPFIYPKYDSKRLKRELDIEKKGKEDGLANIPPHSSKEVIGYEKTITNHLVTKVTEVEAQARAEITGVVNDINNLEFEKLTAKIKNYNVETKNEFERLQSDAGNVKYYDSQEVQEINELFKKFQDDNKLSRPPKYPDSKKFSIAIVCIFVAVEILFNSYFFKEFATLGLLGGIGIAAGVALFNIGLGVLYGEYVSRNINHISSSKKISAYFIGFIYLLITLIINFYAAHLRDKIVVSDRAYEVNPMDVFNNFVNNTFEFQSFGSIILIFIGMFFTLAAMIKMYYADDPYPGYGALDREKKEKTNAHFGEVREYLDMCQDLMQKRVLDIRNTIENVSSNLHLLQNYKSRITLYIDNFSTYLSQVQTIADEIVNEYRSYNMRHRPDPTKFPKYYDKPYVMPYQAKLNIPKSNINELLNSLEEIKKDSQKLTDERVALVHKEYKKALGEFKDIKELDIQSYLNKIDE